MQKMKTAHENDKVMWNRQHQEHALSIEKLYTSRIKNLEDEISDVRRENEVLRAENSRLETEM